MTVLDALPPFARPFASWMTFMMRAGEMMWASGQVINRRTGRALLADPRHRARDGRELLLMGSEKVEAGVESWMAMASHLTALNMRYATVAFGQWAALSNAMLSVAASRTPAQSLLRQARLAQLTMAETGKTAARAASSAARVAHHGLKPIHARATGNARRLRRK
jgi:hypothetical protein